MTKPAWLTARHKEAERLERLFESRRWAMEQASYRWDETKKRWVK